MKLFGHPLHPLLIHFPTALLPMHYILCILYFVWHDASFASASFYCLIGGVTTGILAILAGLIDLLNIPASNKPAMTTALYHGFINGIILVVFTVMAYKDWQHLPEYQDPSVATIVIKGILILLLFAGNYLGGKLIYNYYIGINIKNQEHENA
jgi:uncharacterized membrane protein